MHSMQVSDVNMLGTLSMTFLAAAWPMTAQTTGHDYRSRQVVGTLAEGGSAALPDFPRPRL
jgi:hypothetical protein